MIGTVHAQLDLSQLSGDFVLITDKSSIREYWWQTYPQKSSYIVALKSGSRKLLHSNVGSMTYYFSPDGENLVYFDDRRKAYFNYNYLSGKTYTISDDIPCLS